MKALLLALAASALALPAAAAPARVPLTLAPRPVASYPVVVACPAKTTMDVTPAALPPGWITYGLEPVLEDTSIVNFMGKDELHCNYAAPMHPDVRVATLRLAVDEGACVKGPEGGAFHCKAGTPH